MKGIIIVAAVALALVSCRLRSHPLSSDLRSLLDDNCYAPQLPEGLVTDAQRIAWIDQVGQFGVEAEENFGVPAAAILAISAVESGYGSTLIAINAMNPFGHKYNDKDIEMKGLKYWVLSCQPKEDPNNKYIHFSDYEAAFLFVSKRLALSDKAWANYKAPTDRYIADRNKGVDVQIAVDRWIDGIAAAGYNYDPKTYSITLKKIVRNYVKQSWELSDKYNLIAFSRLTSPMKGRVGNGSPVASSQIPNIAFDINSPQMNSTITGQISLKINVPKHIVKVTYSIQSENKGGGKELELKEPHIVSWDTKQYENGGYIIRIVGYDQNGKGVDEDKRYVIVKN